MRIDDIIIENQNLEEGPVWDKTRQVGATIGKGIGGVSQAVGAVAGVPAGIARGIAKGYNRAADTIAGGPDENPQSGGAQAPQQSQGQSAGSSFAQGLQGGAGSGSSGGGSAVAGKLRQQAKQLMTMADELEKGGDSGGGGAQKAEPQAQQSAPPTQTNQEPQAQQTAQEPTQPQSTTQAPDSTEGKRKYSNSEYTDSEIDAHRAAGGTFDGQTGKMIPPPAKNPALAAPAQQQVPADNVSTTSSTGGQTNQTSTGRVHTANPNNPNFKQASSQDVTDVEPKQVTGQQPQLKMIPGGKGTAADPTRFADRKAKIAQSKADRAAGKGVTGAIRTGTMGESVEFYSKFFKKMI
jgi:hypothetical protein